MDLDALNEPEPHRCVSVGYLVKSNKKGKILLPTIADVEHPDNRHSHGGIMIPLCSIKSIRRLL